jgi:hypothetical protein
MNRDSLCNCVLGIFCFCNVKFIAGLCGSYYEFWRLKIVSLFSEYNQAALIENSSVNNLKSNQLLKVKYNN